MMIRTLLHHHSHHSPRHYRHSHLNSKCCTQLVVRCFTTTPQKEYEDAYQDEDEDGDTTTTTAVVTRTIAGRNNDARGGSAGGWSRTAIPTPTWNTTTATSSSNTNSSNRVPLYQIQSQLQTRSQSKLQSQLQLHPTMESSTLSSLTMTLTSLPIVAATTATRQRDQSATTHSSCRRGYHPPPQHHQHHQQSHRHFTTHRTNHRNNPLTNVSSNLWFQHYKQQQHQQQIRTVFISTENTPNPESIKFLPGTTVLDNEDGRGHSILKSDPVAEILKSPLATSLFKIDGVKAIYYGSDFVSITKFATGKWQFMRPEIFSVLMDFFETPDYQVLLEQPLITDTTILEDDDEIVAMIKELIEDRIRPAVQDDGGDILYVNFDEESGMVTVQLAGSCVGCPSSSVTLKQGVENMLMHYIPEVTAVQALDQPEEDDDDDSDVTITTTTTTNNNDNDNDNDSTAAPKQQKSYEERLAAAGIPFSD